MEYRRQDAFWKVFSVILLIVMVGLVGVIVWQSQQSRPAFYQSRPTAQAKLAALSPALGATGDRFWVSDLAEQALPFVVNIETKMTADERVEAREADESEDMMRKLQEMMPFGMPLDPEEMRELQEQHENMPEDMPSGVGSGFIVREDGYIVTNAHVIDEGNEFTVHFGDGKQLPAKLIGKDDFKDIAVLKVEGKDFPVAPLGNSKDTRIGEPVIAIGSPIGFQATVTAGIISANHRSVEDLAGLNGTPDVRRPQHYLQTDAAINRGNSGGEVIGVNQAIARRDQINAFDWIPIEGIGFAIPIDEVKESIRQIVENGGVKYPGISAQIMSVKDYLVQNPELKLQAKDGVYVSRITVDGPADKAGDVILSIDGKKVDSANDFIAQINTRHVGERVVLRVARQGGAQQEDVSVVLEALDLSAQTK
jgi:serine protease Do